MSAAPLPSPCGLTRQEVQYWHEHGVPVVGGLCQNPFEDADGNILICEKPVGKHLSEAPSSAPAQATAAPPGDELMSELRGLRSDLGGLRSDLGGLRSDLAVQEIRRVRRALDCWVTNNRTMVESAEFKRAVVDFYQRRDVTDPATDRIITARCMVSGGVHKYGDLCPAHLVKHCRPELMTLYDLPQDDIDSPRNGILILKELELAFDHKTVCFLRNPLNGTLVFRVLDPSLLGKRIHPNSATELRTFGDINGCVLQHPAGNLPFQRILSMHAKLSLSRAMHRGWINDEEEIEMYYSISESGLEEPECLRGLTWKEINYADIEDVIV